MATFRLHIDVDNAAFDDNPRDELAFLLARIANDVLLSGNELYWYQAILDSNGNDVGRYAIKED